MLGCNLQWHGQNFEEALHSLMLNRATKPYKHLPFIVSSGVWLTRNKAIFQDDISVPPIVVAQAIGILSHFPQIKEG